LRKVSPQFSRISPNVAPLIRSNVSIVDLEARFSRLTSPQGRRGKLASLIARLTFSLSRSGGRVGLRGRWPGFSFLKRCGDQALLAFLNLYRYLSILNRKVKKYDFKYTSQKGKLQFYKFKFLIILFFHLSFLPLIWTVTTLKNFSYGAFISEEKIIKYLDHLIKYSFYEWIYQNCTK
jgi:hypothetical protein